MTLRLLAVVQLAAAAVLAPLSVWMTASSHPDAGLAISQDEGRVVWVFPGGPTWQHGLRPGQQVVELVRPLDATAWRVITADGPMLYSSSYAGQLTALRNGLPVAVVAALLTAAAFVLAKRVSVAAALAALAIVFASLAVKPTGTPAITSAASTAALLAPALWLAGWGLRRPVLRACLLAGIVAVAGFWLVSRFALPTLFGMADVVRDAALGGVTLSTVVLFGDWRRWLRRAMATPATWADAVAAALILGVSVLIVIVLQLPMLAIAGLVIPAVLLYPRFRSAASAAIDRVVLGDVRDRASIRAVEDERGRIARDIHDAPLQEIAAVIRQLDGKPGTEEETRLLRRVADHLRAMTTELRPPILEDLGLASAIAYVADQAATKAPHIDVQLRLLPDQPVVDRPPPEVELAVFRIVQEAVDNALRHADARRIEIDATVTRTHVSASVSDDGKGVSEAVIRQAAREGHFGFASMAQRAALVGGRLDVHAARPRGTRVALEWDGTR